MSSPPATTGPWPYPRWIAHRGAGTLAPENTLAAFQRGASLGWRMFECDARLSGDGTVFLLHDDTLERTTDGHGPSAAQPWEDLARLDAGRWHSPAFTGEPLPTLSSVLQFCLLHDRRLNIEIKPSPGMARETGLAVARVARRWWAASPAAAPPLLSSFQHAALAAARTEAPDLPRGLLLKRLEPGWLEQARELGCCAVIVQHTHWTAAALAEAHGAGLRALAFTVNEAADAQRLLDWGIDGLITDAVDRFPPD